MCTWPTQWAKLVNVDGCQIFFRSREPNKFNGLDLLKPERASGKYDSSVPISSHHHHPSLC